MFDAVDSPHLVFLISFIVLAISARIGAYVNLKLRRLNEQVRQDLGIIEGAALTLLGLIIGFSFSMAVDRYDQRKNYEEEEANAIGTEYLRLGLLPAAEVPAARVLLLSYVHERIRFYTTVAEPHLRQIDIQTAKLQDQLWNTVQAAGIAHPNPVVALAVAGMNDVINAQGYTQAAYRNRIPVSAWNLMIVIAICCNLLIGYSAHSPGKESRLLLILPLIVSVAFFLIADIESPRHGLIRVHPQNLLSLADSLKSSTLAPTLNHRD